MSTDIHQINSNQSQPAGLYIHIPFCAEKCLYCDFYSITDLAKISSFATALEQEMELVGQTVPALDTLYIGGGTPSMLDAAVIERITAAAFRHFNILPGAEVSIEVNPGTVKLEDFQKYRQAGINRLNIGVQSFREANLKFLDRIHSREEAIASIDRGRQAGFENIGLDLIYGLPKQDEFQWLEDLDRAIRISPEHLSCYILTRESGTALDRQVAAGRIDMPAEDNLRRLFEVTIDHLTRHGFHHYEVSNFARKADVDCSPWKSRHNRKYWSFAPYIGLGPSAHSYLEPQRHWNHRSVEKYLEDIRLGRLPIAEKEDLTREQMIMETIYLGFRTTRGIHLADFKHRLGFDFAKTFGETISGFEKDDLLKLSETHCALTVKGMALLDSITAAFTNQDMPDGRGQMTED
jgi:oxygen-independent coproporphyrinogen-3 oxidase